MGERAPHIRILMGTCQGARHLPAQLASFVAQRHGNWSLWVSDDGSTDGTWQILQRFARDHPTREIRLFSGPEQGFSTNYLSLLNHPALPRDGALIALSDQDDVWAPERLTAVAAYLGQMAPGRPVLYGANTIVTDAALRPLDQTRRHRGRFGFPNALLQNVIAGNTAALSPGALALVRRAQPAVPVPFHDWWLYLLITGAGGAVLYDPAPRLFYRQHGANALGAHRGLGPSWRRLMQLQNGTYQTWIATNLAALRSVRAALTPPHRACVDRLYATRGTAGLTRLRSLRRAGVLRRDPAGQLAVSLLALTGHI